MMSRILFQNRKEAGRQLAERLQERDFDNPLVLAVPRGGVAVGAALAHDLHADLDVLLARKLRAPYNAEVAVGAVAENGPLYINESAAEAAGLTPEYLTRELLTQRDEIQRRATLFRGIRPQAPITGRSVIVVDDGIATGSTLIAGLQATRAQRPLELIVAVPVAPPDRLPSVKEWCDEIVCLVAAHDFMAVGQFYRDFHQLNDEEVAALLRDFIEEIPVTAPN
jgi:putative phosphoribosyl transferase